MHCDKKTIFFRCLVDPMRPKQPEDISKPLQNSFIHTGHGSAFGDSWGSPAYIDDMYLRNPMEPPDIIGLQREAKPSPQLCDRKKVVKNSELTDQTNRSETIVVSFSKQSSQEAQ